MRVLCVGDVVGSPGRKAAKALLPDFIEQRGIDFVIINAENIAGGAGITVETARQLLALPVDVLTGGNHTWRHKEVVGLLERERRLLRPLNFPAGTPGHGAAIYESKAGVSVGVINAMGRVFMTALESPFECVAEAAARLREQTPIVIVDFHAEATSEKRALGWYLDGKISALFGTHTHVPTADEEVLPEGTGYITDIGMTGPYASVLGVRTEAVIERFLTMRPNQFAVAKGDVRVCGVIFDIDEASGRTQAVERVMEKMPA